MSSIEGFDLDTLAGIGPSGSEWRSSIAFDAQMINRMTAIWDDYDRERVTVFLAESACAILRSLCRPVGAGWAVYGVRTFLRSNGSESGPVRFVFGAVEGERRDLEELIDRLEAQIPQICQICCDDLGSTDDLGAIRAILIQSTRAARLCLHRAK